jgi:outer membrane protein
VSAVAETAAEHSLAGATLSEYFTASQSVASAVSAYWNYRAAQQRLDVFRESELRADRMVVETQVLVDAEERTTTDLKQLKANLGAKRVARINAEQALTEAWQQLALAMGVSRDRITTPPPAATEFPQLPADTLTTNTIAGWERTALAQRADVAAATAALRAAEAARRASRADLKPRLDVVVDLGYSGLAQGAGVQRLVAPLYRDVPGLNSSVQLSYQLPVMNAGAQGRLAQANASYQQQELVVRETERRIASDVAVAAAALQHGRLALIESRGAVELWATSVQSEQRKFRLGASTIFDIIQAQDAHTNARLGEIASANGYAVALTRLRFATGTLLHRDASGTTATWTDLLVAP